MLDVYLSKRGCDAKTIKRLTICSNSMGLSGEEYIKKIEAFLSFLKTFGYKKSEAFKIYKQFPYILKVSHQDIETLIGELLDLYKMKDIILLTKDNPKLLKTSIQSIHEKFAFFKKLDYSDEVILKIGKRAPNIFKVSTEYLGKQIKEICSLGFSFNDILKLIKEFPFILLLSKNKIQEKIDEIMCLGYSKLEALKIIKNYSMIFRYPFKSLQNKILEFEALGFTHEQALIIFKTSPVVFSYDIETIKSKLREIKKLGFTEENIRTIVLGFSALLGSDIEAIIAKLNYYIKLNIIEFILRNPKNLIQSLELSQARMQFFQKHEIELNEENAKRLFYAEQHFKTCYGIDKQSILAQFGEPTSPLKKKR